MKNLHKLPNNQLISKIIGCHSDHYLCEPVWRLKTCFAQKENYKCLSLSKKKQTVNCRKPYSESNSNGNEYWHFTKKEYF